MGTRHVSDSDIKARIIGMQTKMQTFSFIHGILLAIVIIFHSDIFNSILQRAEIFVVDAQKNAKLSVTFLLGIRSYRDASLHWTTVTQATVKVELQAPSLQHCLMMPLRYFEANAQPEHHSCSVILLPDLH